MSLRGKVVLVTGAGQGIGESIVLSFSKKGAKVVVNDVNMDGVSLVVKKIKSEGGDCLGLKADVSKRGEVKAMVDQTVGYYGTLDVLVNNAGIMKPAPLETLSEEDWDIAVNVDLKGTFLCSQFAAQIMIPRRRGRIINIASVSGHEPYPGGGAYSTSKAGVIMLTKQCAVEWGKYNIQVNAISPGLIVTPLNAKAYEDPNIRQGRENMVPLNRLGLPEDVASMAVLLASDESGYVSGCTIEVDGGFLRNMQQLLPGRLQSQKKSQEGQV
jgi:NAD(P)-dependent dehydrogenase (short-subunit alcohol dehydrogenase family)